MLRNYLRTGIRALSKDKSFTLINISGLAVGFSCCIFIALWASRELSYDSHHQKASHVVRLVYDEFYNGENNPWAYSWSSWGPGIKENYPQVKEYVRIAGNPNHPAYLVEANDRVYREAHFFHADESIFDVFDFEFVEGSPSTALADPDAIVLSKATSTRLFGDVEAIGKLVRVNNEETYRVSAVVMDWPETSHFKIDYLASFQRFYRGNPQYHTEWIYTYLLLEDPKAADVLVAHFPAYTEKFVHNPDFGKVTLKLQRLKEIHLNSERQGELSANGNRLYVDILSAGAFFILAIICLNFFNLSSARSMGRLRELGIRKLLGARRAHVSYQFLTEAFLLTTSAFVIGIGILELLLPWLNNWFHTQVDINLFAHFSILVLILLICLFTTILAGFYPLYRSSSLTVSQAFKQASDMKSYKNPVRSLLVGVQFFIASGLLMLAFIVVQQVTFIKNKETGFLTDQVITVPISNTAVKEKYEVFRTALLGHRDIAAVTACSTLPAVDDVWVGTFNVSGRESPWIAAHLLVDEAFIASMGIDIIEGRPFSQEIGTDATNAFVINKAAQQSLEWDDAVGKSLNTWGDKTGPVIGVVENFNFETLHYPVRPLVFHISPRHFNYVLVKTSGGQVKKVLELIETEWNQIEPDWPLQYSFLDQDFERVYYKEENLSRLISTFTLFAVFFAAIGLWGVASLNVQLRIKEVGIRKVLGASLGQIIALLSKNLMRIILLACVLAGPLTYILAEWWLSSFANRTSVGLWSFVIITFGFLSMAGLIIVQKSLRIAKVNPVEILKNE